MYDNHIYEMALEMLSPVNEAFGKGIKELMSADAREGVKCLKEARKFRRAGNEKEAQKQYQKCLDYYGKVRNRITKIEDETLLDWVINLCIKPLWYLVFQTVMADGNLKGLTRQSALKDIDTCIKNVKHEKANP